MTKVKKHLYNNGKIQIKLGDNEAIPEGFSRGGLCLSTAHKNKIGLANSKALKGKESNNKNKHYYNNGVIEKFFSSTDTIPAGFIPGRLASVKNKIAKNANKLPWNKNKHNIYSAEYLAKLKKSKSDRIVMTNGKQTKRIKKEDYDNYLKAGWKIGIDNRLLKVYRSEEVNTKRNNTKYKNKSFNTSKDETVFNKFLLKLLNQKGFYRQYTEVRYPFSCDFYIPKFDLFIELNHHWTHGSKPYNKEDSFCKKQLATWHKKSKKSNFYKNAIEIWTKRDPLKLKTAKENNLNYLVSYNKEDMYKIMEYIKKLIKESN